MNWIDIATLLTAIATMIGVLITATALILEERRSRTIHEVQLLMHFNDVFDSVRMRKQRARASQFLLRQDKPIESDDDWEAVAEVLGFYQMLGNIVRLRQVRTELAYKDFFYWLSHYGKACTTYIKYTQHCSPVTFSDAIWLHSELKGIDHRTNKGALGDPSHDQLQRFFVDEVKLCSDP